MIQRTEAALIKQAFAWLFSTPLWLARCVLIAWRRLTLRRLHYAPIDHSEETQPSDPLEPLYARRGKRYVATATLGGPLFRRVGRRYVAVCISRSNF